MKKKATVTIALEKLEKMQEIVDRCRKILQGEEVELRS